MQEPAQLEMSDLAAAIARRAVNRPRVLVGIDGPGASGKSTLASDLAGHLERAAVVHVDDFYLPSGIRDRRRGEVGALFDLPRLARQVILPAVDGGPLRYQRYDWEKDALTDWSEVPAKVPLIVEGVYCLEQCVRNAYTYTVFCHCDSTVRLRRGLDRDGESARASWVDEWMPAEDAYLAAQHPDDFANLVIDSSGGALNGGMHFEILRWKQ